MGRRRLLWNLLLLLVCFLLTAGLVKLWWGQEQEGGSVKGPQPLEWPQAPVLRDREPLDAFRLVIQKNLFSPDRTGEEAHKPTKGQTSLEGSKLLGIIIIGVEKAALVAEPAGRPGRKAVQVLRQGETWGNYQVVDITGEGLVLEGKEGRKTLDFPQ
ncbi:MAG: hypothetical protein FJ128_12585 [Deltaproteobacteria bacterium]|nr:hypothetical protein [Deltaproteobacteria bacterium]